MLGYALPRGIGFDGEGAGPEELALKEMCRD